MGTPTLAAGAGETSFWGNVTFSTLGTLQDQRLALLHERVHQFLAPKLYFMRTVRVQGRIDSYFCSSLYRWFEETLAETFARMRVLGANPQQAWQGISFPVRQGYVLLTRGGGFDAGMAGRGLLPEGAALLARGTVLGVPWVAYHTLTPPVSGGER